MQTTEYYEVYWSDAGFQPRGRTPLPLERLFRRWIQPGWNCLDVGCGDGRTSGPWLTRHGCEYRGVDISSNAVRDACAHGLDAQVIEDAASLPFASDSFDAVVCIEVMEHLFEPQLAAAEIRRVLKPGGILLATVPNVAYWRRRLELLVLGRWNPLGDPQSVARPWRDPHIRFFTAGALRRMLESCGYGPIRVGGHGGAFLRDLPWLGKRLRCGDSSSLYRAAEQRVPAVLGYALHCIATKSQPHDPANRPECAAETA